MNVIVSILVMAGLIKAWLLYREGALFPAVALAAGALIFGFLVYNPAGGMRPDIESWF